MKRALACLIILSCFWATQARADVAFDVCATSLTTASATTTNTNNNLTVSGGLTNSALVATLVVTQSAITAPSMTWNGVTMTLVSSQSSAVNSQVFIFALRNPASGNNALVANWTTSSQTKLTACSFQGVSQVSDAAAFAHANGATGLTTGASSVTITSATGDMIVAAHSISSGANISAVSGTQVYIDNTGSISDAAMNRDNGAASVAMSATIGSSTEWAAAGIDIVAAGAASPCIHSLTLTGAGC